MFRLHPGSSLHVSPAPSRRAERDGKGKKSALTECAKGNNDIIGSVYLLTLTPMLIGGVEKELSIALPHLLSSVNIIIFPSHGLIGASTVEGASSCDYAALVAR